MIQLELLKEYYAEMGTCEVIESVLRTILLALKTRNEIEKAIRKELETIPESLRQSAEKIIRQNIFKLLNQIDTSERNNGRRIYNAFTKTQRQQKAGQ